MKEVKKAFDDMMKKRNEFINNRNSKKGFINKFKYSIPNILTYIRLVTPFIAIPVALTGNFLIALLIGVIGSFTDLFDGICARKFDATSEYGRVLDAFTDKSFAILMCFPFIFNPQYIITLAMGELIIASINFKSQLNNNNPESTMLGKIKATLLYTYIASLYLVYGLSLPKEYLIIPLVATNIAQIATAIEYKNIDLKKENNKQKIRELQSLKESFIKKDDETNKIKKIEY